MALIDREVGVAVAATAGLLSPRAREVARKGAVYGLAGVMKVGDVVVGGARGAARGATEGASTSNGKAAPEHSTDAASSSGTGEPIPLTGATAAEPPAAQPSARARTSGGTSKPRRSPSAPAKSRSKGGGTTQ